MISMSEETPITLDEAVAHAKALPMAQQAQIAEALELMVRDVASMPLRSNACQGEIARRLQQPFNGVSREQIDALLDRYDPK